MPRANRYFVPNHVWHITHRCHKQEFLLKFSHDRQRWIYWLREASKRFDVSILNYTVTSNHIHLLVRDNTTPGDISAMVQLVAGRTAQEYNQRKGRKGAFWEDRYHATAIECGTHLWRCLVYVDLNMFRAGVVRHPKEWRFGGYHEIVGSKNRNRILDRKTLLDLLELNDISELENQHQAMVDESLSQQVQDKEKRWTESLAVGSREFATDFHARLRTKRQGRKVVEEGSGFVVREGLNPYGADFCPEN